ncbi:MAG: tRNA (adenosine(37)-N6)-threonylcarbamoyltransferase complex dimerization subunit type 1 TsaB [Oscillospiraceae bacterium]|nr:tRNA (adenosine(37)-N6)-threonylcarbamoyltransferase complex dimerization subunit type 1 TsaB [Oscillospiraceae bacterium]MCL2277941.1 tRNA (adenosine(37)-N6)-threonylcarbamoyltransferase complex dimerization subunit type 1 TsaB [Oscillospiraceae bacterium]
MLIIAFESSARPASVAVLEVCDTSADSCKHKLLGQYFQNNGFSHSRTLMSMAETLLKSLNLKPADIGLAAVARGPGSFTGIRIGVSAVKGLAWGLDIPVCGVSTLEAMARQTRLPGTIICPVMDARRSQVYNALFKWHGDKLKRLRDDRAISIDELSEDLKHYGEPFMFVGDGTEVCKKSISDNNLHDTPEILHYQTAYGVALAALHAKPISSEELEPSYLRPSQAERERNSVNN